MWLESWEKKNVTSTQAAVVKGTVAAVFVAATLAWAIPFGNLPKNQYNLAHPFFVLLPITTYCLLVGGAYCTASLGRCERAPGRAPPTPLPGCEVRLPLTPLTPTACCPLYSSGT
jgi:hypothetical protein